MYFPLVLMCLFLAVASSCEKNDDIGLNGKTTAVFKPEVTYGTMTDQDGNVYKTVTMLQRRISVAPGIGSCTALTTIWPEVTSISRLVFLFVV